MNLYRPCGPDELRLVFDSGMRTWPPRLPEQPIFYPVLNHGYAAQIARDWNAQSPAQAGYVTRFELSDAFAAQFPRRVVGGREHEELWVPADRLDELNSELVGRIEVVGAFFGPRFDKPAAVAELRALAGALEVSQSRLDSAVASRQASVLLNYPYWASNSSIGTELQGLDLSLILLAVKRSWQSLNPEIVLHP